MSSESLICSNCIDSLTDSPFIECADCAATISQSDDDDSDQNASTSTTTSKKQPLRLCIDCFSCGAELGAHKRTHRYLIKNSAGDEQITLFSGQLLSGDGHSWSVREELGLLEGIERYNLGNWEDIANNYVKSNDPTTDDKTRTSREITEHYDRFYLHGVMGRTSLENMKRPDDRDHTIPLAVSVEMEADEALKSSLKGLPSPPMKEGLRKIASDDFRLLAYMPKRDDFEKEFNNDAEQLISNLMILPDDDDLDKAVKVAQIEMYIREVAERRRRKIVAREYDLVSAFLKTEKSYSKVVYSYSVPEQKKMRIERELKEQLKKCAQFIPSTDFEQLIADIIKERTLKERIKELQDYRREGVTTLEGEKRLQENENSTLKRRSNDEEADEFDIPTAPKRMSIDGNECDSGKNVWPKPILDQDSVLPILSRSETMLCDDCKLSTQEYVLLKTALLKEQATKAQGLPLRANVGGGGSNSDDVVELKNVVKDFLKKKGWLNFFC